MLHNIGKNSEKGEVEIKDVIGIALAFIPWIAGTIYGAANWGWLGAILGWCGGFLLSMVLCGAWYWLTQDW